MKYQSAKKLILHVCDKYWDAKRSYKNLQIYCFLEQGETFPLSIDALLRCYSTETIRRTFQELKKDGEIVVDEETQKNWDKAEGRIHTYYSAKKKKREEIHQRTQEMIRMATITDPLTGKVVSI